MDCTLNPKMWLELANGMENGPETMYTKAETHQNTFFGLVTQPLVPSYWFQTHWVFETPWLALTIPVEDTRVSNQKPVGHINYPML